MTNELDVNTAVSAARLSRDIEMLDANIKSLEALITQLRMTRNRLDANARIVCNKFGI